MITPANIYKSKILIVDDQAANVKLLEQMLAGAGYSAVSSTSNSLEVYELHHRNRYDLILLDLQMPGLDGFQVMEGLKELEVGCYLPVLVITAQPVHKLRALKAGAKDFVSKPFDLGEVLIRVYNMLEVRLLHRESEMRTESAEAHFIEAQKMEAIGKLAGGVAHDFNNILSVIMGYNDLLNESLPLESKWRSYTEEIRQASEQAVGLTRQLLVFSRKETVQLAGVNINEVVRKQDKILERLMDANVEIVLRTSDEIGTILADPGYLGQIVMNLVINARDAMPDGGVVTIGTENTFFEASDLPDQSRAKPGEYVLLSVNDTGTGMTEEVKAHVFEAFYTTKPSGKGTGLGLATCQTIVQKLGGHIEIESRLGEGTTFRVYFPKIKAAAPSVRPAGLCLAPRGVETLMIVEDDPCVRQLARGILEAQGYVVVVASDGQDALRKFRNHKGATIRLVVTDIMMPLMGGEMMAECLKTTHPDVQILFTSGYANGAIATEGIVEEGVDFIPKPYTKAALGQKVRELLDRTNPLLEKTAA